MMNQTYRDETGFTYPAQDFCSTTPVPREAPYPVQMMPEQYTAPMTPDQQVWERVQRANQTETTIPAAASQRMSAEPAAEAPAEPSAASQPLYQHYQAGQNGNPATTGMSSQFAQQHRMKNPLSMRQTANPSDSHDVYLASLRSLLDRNIGYFISATFLLGTNQTVTWQGILHTVGSDFLVLYQPNSERYISCDFYSLKFVQFYNTKTVPRPAADNNWQGRYGM